MKPWIQRSDGALALEAAEALQESVPLAMARPIRVQGINEVGWGLALPVVP